MIKETYELYKLAFKKILIFVSIIFISLTINYLIIENIRPKDIYEFNSMIINGQYEKLQPYLDYKVDYKISLFE